MGGVDEPTGGGADGAEPLRLVEPHGARRPPGAALALVALVWSFLDARGGRSVSWVLLVWAVVGLVLGALGALQAQGLDGPLDRGILLDDLKGLPLMGGLLTLVPALVGAMVGWVIRGLGGSGR